MAKQYLPIILTMALFAGSSVQAADINSQTIEAVSVTSISSNGKWIMGQADGEGLLYVKNLAEDKQYLIGGNITTDGTGYTAGVGRCISNNGTVIALFNGIPQYWVPDGTASGKWTKLPGKAVDGSAVLGSITPDGKMIVGSIGDTGNVFDDICITNPVVWYRQDDGTYGDPVALPCPPKDPFGARPMYVNLVAVSDNGKVIGATMTTGTGMFEVPYIFTQDDAGNWTYSCVGEKLLNPNSLTFPGYPGEMRGQLDPFSYLNEEQTAAFWAAFNTWKTEEPQASLDDEDFQKLQYKYMAEFMDEKTKEEYLKVYEDFFEEFDKFRERDKAFNDFITAINTDGVNFMMNNGMVTPDGQYAFFTSEKTFIIDPEQGEEGIEKRYVPIRFDVATGDYVTYENEKSMVLTSVGNQGVALCRIIGLDDYWPNEGWIFPVGDLKGMSIPDYVKANGSQQGYTWMEENMYREIITGLNPNGSYRYDDAWTVGNAYCSADLGLIACSNSTQYWADSYYDGFSFVSFVVNTGVNVVSSGVEIMETNNSVAVLKGGEIRVEGMADITVYDLSGSRVFHASGVSGKVSTGLGSGIYIVDVAYASGERKAVKAVF